MTVQEVIKVEHRELIPPYSRYLVRLIRPFPNWDFFFIKSLRRQATAALRLGTGCRVLDGGCGPGGTFPYLIEAVGSSGEVLGLEISPETAINARLRIEVNRWTNVSVLQGDARTVEIPGMFDALVMFAAPDVYASPEAVSNLFGHLKNGARVAVFGAKLSNGHLGGLLNMLFRTLMKLSFSSTPDLSHDPLSVLKSRLVDVQMQEHLFGCMFLASGSVRLAISSATAGHGNSLEGRRGSQVER